MTAEDKIAALHQQIEERGHLQAKIWILRGKLRELVQSFEASHVRYQRLAHQLKEEILLGTNEQKLQNPRDLAKLQAEFSELRANALAQKQEIEQQIEALQGRIDELS